MIFFNTSRTQIGIRESASGQDRYPEGVSLGTWLGSAFKNMLISHLSNWDSNYVLYYSFKKGEKLLKET